MPRRAQIPKRPILPDPVFQSPLVTRFINSLMMSGKKSIAEHAFYGAMDTIKERTSDDPLRVFRKAVDNVKPALEVKSRRVGGSNYQVPIEVRPQRRTALAIRWLIGFARSRPEKSMREKLANEFMDAASSRGAAFKKKEDTHRMAEANKAFAHYRW
jgi:small subunit ribosomal protein S7